MSLLYCELEDKIIIYAIKPFNEHYIDDKVDDINIIFDITVGFFSKKRQTLDYELLSSYFNNYSQFIYKNQLNSNIHDSIGEAAKIARYWYTEGVRLLNKNQAKYDESINSFPFSEDFVSEILAADIEGVNTIEVYPFDRCFIFENSALDIDKRSNDDSLDIVVTEATLLQNSLNDQKKIQERENYLYEWDRHILKTEDYDIDFSKKRIEHIPFCIESSQNIYKTLAVKDDSFKSNEAISIKYDTNNDTTFHDFKHDDAKAINFMLHNLIHKNAPKKDILDLEQKYFTENNGLCYIYLNGVNQDDIPLLKELQKSYWLNILQKHQTKDNILIESLQDNKNLFENFIEDVPLDNTKVVFISYDPTKVNNVKDNIKINEKNAFSMIIIANWDVPKTISDIIAEKEDLFTALKLVVRQKTEANALISQERDKQSKFVLNLLRQAIHGIKGKVKDQNTKDDIDKVYEAFRDDIKKNKIELSSYELKAKDSQERIHKLFFGDTFLLSKLKEDSQHSSMHKIYQALQHSNYARVKLNSNIHFIFQKSFIPNFSIKVDSMVIQEALHVMLKNAIEATEKYKGQDKEIFLLLNVSYAENNKAILNFQIVNPTNGLSKERIYEMNTATDDMSIDLSKDNSTGVGVPSSRVQLESRFGKDANIRFSLITKTRIKSILSLPIALIDSDLYIDEENFTNENEQYDVLYLEDSEKFYIQSNNFLDSSHINYLHSKSRQEAIAYFKDFKILFLDMNIFKNKDSDSVERIGVKIIKQVQEVNKDAIIILVSDEAGMDYKVIDNTTALQQGKVYNGKSKSIADIVERSPSLSKLMKELSTRPTEEIFSPTNLLKPKKINKLSDIKNAQENIYIFNTVVSTLEQLDELKEEWQNIEFYDEDNIACSLSDTDTFSSTFVIETKDIITKDNASYINYLAIKNNLLIVPQDITLEQISVVVQQRRNSYLYPAGILNGIKHDLSDISDNKAKELKIRIETNKIYSNSLQIKCFSEGAKLICSITTITELTQISRELKTLLDENLTNDKYKTLFKKYPSLEYFLSILKIVGTNNG
ncbi:hypothetical protein JHD49_10940 [Sulfurimonas sp. SAG-AH-194-C21]|nr:hypothetical protein [Sulfurimonas sp. SAG-AH-194-C21]MDF1884457.1 hypothetical protein [Sulfurimonas sp. SAG-AH-194-C21]